MKIHYLKSKETKGIHVSVTPKEAESLIVSLATQLRSENPNTGRVESIDEKGKYFSISVIDFDKREEAIIEKYGKEEIIKLMKHRYNIKEPTYD